MADVDYRFESYAYYYQGELLSVSTSTGGFLVQYNVPPLQAGLGIFTTDDPVAQTIGADHVTHVFYGSVNFQSGTSDGSASNGALPVAILAPPADQDLRLVYSFEPDFEFPQFLPTINRGSFLACFAEGTLIATAEGERAVENLRPGDILLTHEGNRVPMHWLGRTTMTRAFSGLDQAPVRIRAGALGKGLPHRDLTVTGDHGLLLDGIIVNAGALAGGAGIDWVPLAQLPETYTLYHVATERHAGILANGLPAETYIPTGAHWPFDTCVTASGEPVLPRIIPELPLPRVSSARLLPPAIRERLGLTDHLAIA